MTVNGTVVSHLEAARDELLRERSELERNIAELNDMIGKFSRPALEARTVGTAHIGQAAEDDRPPSMRKAILIEVGKAAPGRYVASGDVVQALTAQYDWQAASIRSLMVRMTNDGDLEKGDRGLYRLPLPTNADSPAVSAGLSVLTVPTTEGGDDGAAYPGDRDNQLP